MSTTANSELEQIHNNVKIMSDFVDNLTKKLSSYFGDLDEHYASYLKLLNSSTSATTSTNTPGYSFKYVDSEYQKLTTKLHKIIENIGNDFLEIHNLANEMIVAYERINSLKDEIEISKKLPDSLEKMALINRLNSKYVKKVMNYNKLAATFNAYASKLTATKQYLNNDLIIYSPNSSNKKYSLSIKQIINWFKDLASPNGVSLLRGEIIARMAKNYSTDLNTLINTPPLTSVSVMDPYSLPRNETQNQTSFTPSNINYPGTSNSFMGTSFGAPLTKERFAGIPQVGTSYAPTRMSMPGYIPRSVGQDIPEQPEGYDNDAGME
uniref:BVpp35a protein n=1 Tax=Chelonus inanitus TaxID=49201 RepID=D7FB39_9HYME|nr:BVpp35a protein [Chelonus inanitus]